MLKSCAMILFVFMLISSHAYAQNVIHLSPKESKSLTNNYVWTLNATCHMQVTKTTSVIVVSVLDNKGRVNGKELEKGQTTSITVKNNENISVSADPGTTVHLVNMGTDSVQAVCST